jgi:ABC-type transport system involved in cytochrome bd biosynthesis fused ATPase/permease subunit
VPAAKPCGEHDWTLENLEHRSEEHLQADERSYLAKRSSSEQGRSKIMPLIQLLEVLIVVGVLLWLVNRFIPMQGSIKSILNGVVVIAVVLWLLNVFGLFHSLSGIRIGKS